MESKEERNWIKLAFTLVDLGTNTVRNIFVKMVQEKYHKNIQLSNDLDTFYKSPLIKEKIQKNERLFNKDMLQKYFGKNRFSSVKSYDLTGLTILISILDLIEPPSNGWGKEPNNFEKSKGAALVRIRIIRNKLYGHIPTPNISDDEFSNNFQILEENLLILGATSEEISDAKKKFSDTTKVELEKRIRDLMENDIADMHRLLTLLKTRQEELIGINQTWNKRFEELQESNQQGIEYSKKIVSLISEIRDNPSGNPFIQNLLSEEIKSQVSKCIEQQLLQPKLIISKNPNESLFQIGEALKYKSAFRILILTSSIDKKEVESLGDACGLCSWDVIIDLNFDSQLRNANKFRSALTVMLIQKKDYTTCTYDKLNSDIYEHSQIIDGISNGQKCLWIFANGCEDRKCSPCIEEFGATALDISNVLRLIISKIDKKPVQSLFLIMNNCNPDEFEAIEMLSSQLKIILDAEKKVINLEYSFQMCLIFEDVYSSWCEQIEKIKLFSPSKKLVNKGPYPIKTAAPISQITALLRQCFESNSKATQFLYIPGNNNYCEIKLSDIKRMEGDVIVYHKDIGIIYEEDSIKMQQLKQDFKVKFLKGQTISPEALHLHEIEPPVYVERTEMREIRKIIGTELSHRKAFSDYEHGYRGIFTLEHDPGAGGSSCGRYLLYVFKEKYPCIEITKISPNTVSYVQFIHNQTKLPLLIIMDIAHFDQNEFAPITEFVSLLENNFVIALVVMIVRRHFESVKNQYKKDLYYYLPTSVNSNDIEQFRKVYEESKKWVQLKTVFQFGLFKFLNENNRLSKHVLDCTNLASEIELRILRVICYLWKYAYFDIKISVLLKSLICDERQVNYDEELLMETLKNVQDFIVCNKRNGLTLCKLADNCLIPLLMDKFVEKIPIKENEKSQMFSFIMDLFGIILRDFRERADSYELVKELFIKREKTEQQEREKFTQFIMDFTSVSGRNIVSEIIQKFVELFPPKGSGGHLRAMHARYLMYECNKYEEAVAEIKCAVGASNVQIDDPKVTHDTVLLHNYGHLIVYKARRDFEQSKDKSNFGLKEFENCVKEAIKAYQRAQNSGPPYNALTYISEAYARHELLDKYLKHKCHKKPQELYKLCAVEGSFLKECRKNAEERLQQLEILIETGQINNINELETINMLNSLKWELIKLHYDGEPDTKALERLSDNIPCDIGLLIFKCHYQNRIPSVKDSWLNLPLHLLRLMYRILNKRILKKDVILRNNYKDLIYCLICIRRHLPTETQYSVDYAVNCADQWTKHFPLDYDAHFHLGTLLLLQAMDTDVAESLLLRSRNHFKKSEEIATGKQINIKGLRGFRFFIKKGIGLERLIFYDKEIDRNTLEKFFGAQKSKNEVSVKITDSLIDAHFDSRKIPDLNKPDQTAQMSFHLALRIGEIWATEPEYVQ